MVGQQQDRRPDDGGQPGVEVEEPVQGVDVKELGGQPAAEQRPDDPDHAGQDQALLPATGDQRVGDKARDEPENDPCDDAHNRLLSQCRKLTYGVAGPARQIAVGEINSRGLLPFNKKTPVLRCPLKFRGAAARFRSNNFTIHRHDHKCPFNRHRPAAGTYLLVLLCRWLSMFAVVNAADTRRHPGFERFAVGPGCGPVVGQSDVRTASVTRRPRTSARSHAPRYILLARRPQRNAGTTR